MILHRQPDGIWRFDCQLPPGADPAAELEDARLRQRIATHLDWLGNTEPWTVEWSSVYSARALSLDKYVHGRVVFAGDAAHMVPIFGVRGLNSGLADADTLADLTVAEEAEQACQRHAGDSRLAPAGPPPCEEAVDLGGGLQRGHVQALLLQPAAQVRHHAHLIADRATRVLS